MAVRSASDLVYLLIARLPFVALVVGVAWVLIGGMQQLEAWSYGTEWFVGNEQTTNVMPTSGAAHAANLQAALESGDNARMEAALADLDAARARIPAR